MIAAMFLAPFCTGWLIFATARRISRSDKRFLGSYRRPLVAEIASTCLVLAGTFSTIIFLLNRFIGRWTAFFGLDLLYPPQWGVLSLATLVGTLVAYPLHLWMIRRGMIRWGKPAMIREGAIRKLAWYQQGGLILLALILMLAVMSPPFSYRCRPPEEDQDRCYGKYS